VVSHSIVSDVVVEGESGRLRSRLVLVRTYMLVEELSWDVGMRVQRESLPRPSFVAENMEEGRES
jgi:hypothetical protein